MATAATAVGASVTFSTAAEGRAIDRTSPAHAPDSWKPSSVCALDAARAKPGILGPCAARAFLPPSAVSATMTRTREPMSRVFQFRQASGVLRFLHETQEPLPEIPHGAGAEIGNQGCRQSNRDELRDRLRRDEHDERGADQ